MSKINARTREYLERAAAKGYCEAIIQDTFAGDGTTKLAHKIILRKKGSEREYVAYATLGMDPDRYDLAKYKPKEKPKRRKRNGGQTG